MLCFMTLPWVLSGRTGDGLRSQASRLLARAESDAEVTVMEVGRALAAPSVSVSPGAVVRGVARAGLPPGVGAVAEDARAANVIPGGAAPADRLVFVFPGQGTQWVGMAAQLLDSAP